MNIEIAKLIAESSDLELYEDYSGRGMYGRTTAGVTADSLPQFLEAISMVYHDLIQEALYANDDEDTSHILDRSNDLGRMLESIQYDSLGMGKIFY